MLSHLLTVVKNSVCKLNKIIRNLVNYMRLFLKSSILYGNGLSYGLLLWNFWNITKVKQGRYCFFEIPIFFFALLLIFLMPMLSV